MSLSNIVRLECHKCGKVALEKSRIRIGKTTIIKLVCGHLMSQSAFSAETESYESLVFADGNKPRPYQIDAIKFAEKANARCIIADEAGLGKTIESLCLLKLHPQELLPAIICCPSTVKLQWMYEIHRICADQSKANGATDKQWLTQVIETSKELAMPGFQVYIMTYELLKKDSVFKMLPPNYIKTIILDECQRIKNHLSERAKAVQRMVADQEIDHILPMSGTPIKNNAGEYFTVLNLVDPMRFTSWNRFKEGYCEYYNNGWGDKIGGLKNPEQFHADTKDIIIRRTKDDVLKDLPSLERRFHHVELDRRLNKVYDKLLEELDETYYNEDSFTRTSAMIAIFSKLRHIVGLSKVSAENSCIDFVTEFLLSTDRKIVIFLHHDDVLFTLRNKLNEWLKLGGFEECLVIEGSHTGNQRAEHARLFKETNARVLLASTLASGEGLNLQFCSDAIMLERQWNPANEEQAEGRFHRFGQKNPVTITYMLASGTIDDMFTKIVEAKRAIVASTMDNKQIQWDQQSLMRELAEALISRGRTQWTY